MTDIYQTYPARLREIGIVFKDINDLANIAKKQNEENHNFINRNIYVLLDK